MSPIPTLLRRATLAFLSGLVVLLAVAWPRSATSQENPFRVEIQAITVPAGGEGRLDVLFVIPSGFHMFRDMMEVTVPDAAPFQVGKARFPKGDLVPDPAFPSEKREQYEADVTVRLPVKVPSTVKPGDYDLDVAVRFQGCKAALCYLPQEQTVSASIRVGPGKAPVGGAAEAAAAAQAPVTPEGAVAPAPEPPAPIDMAVFGARPALDEKAPVAVRLHAGDGDEVLVGFFLAEGWHVNRALTAVEVPEGTTLKIASEQWPATRKFVEPTTGMEREEIAGDFVVRLVVPGARAAGASLHARYQACKESLCQLPQTVDLPLVTSAEAGAAPAVVAPPAATAPGAADVGATAVAPALGAEVSTFERMQQKGLFWLVLFVFGAGFLVSLTPCVLPMVPVTMAIIGARADGGRGRALALSAAYVAGLTLVYTILGVVAGLTGSLFGGWMQSPWVVGAVAVFFAAMGLSMFGLFDVAMPSGVTTRLNQVGGAGFVGAFIVGMVGALVAGPCSGPVIVSLMVLIGQQGQVALGAGLMAAFSLGMGVIFLVAGMFSSTLFRPGAWMESVKHVFGVLLLLAAIWFGHSHLPDAVVPLLVSAVLLTTGVFGWPANEDEGFVLTRGRRLYGIVAVLVGGWLLVGSFMTRGWLLPPAGGAAPAAQGVEVAQARIPWLRDEAAAVEAARVGNLPLLVDFGAEWCTACKELEHFTYTDPQVVAAATSFVPLMVDATASSDPRIKELLARYEVKGLPTVLFILPGGKVQADLTVTGFMKAPEFLGRMQEALRRAGGSEDTP